MARLCIAVLGGANSAESALVHYIAKYAFETTKFKEIYGARYGNVGLINNNFCRVLADDINPNRGACAQLGTKREPITFTSQVQFDQYRSTRDIEQTDYQAESQSRLDKLVKNLKKEGIKHLVYIGGEGTLLLAKHVFDNTDINVVYVPASMDDDVLTNTNFDSQELGSTITVPLIPGYSTAVEEIARSAQSMINLARTGGRGYLFATMGGQTGMATLAAVTGGAHGAVTPEGIKIYCSEGKRDIVPLLCERVAHFHGLRGTKRDDPHSLFAIFEGTPIFHEAEYTTDNVLGYDTYGKRVRGAEAAYLRACKAYFKDRREDVELATKVCDYDPKSIGPSRWDSAFVRRLCERVALQLREGETDGYVTLKSVVGLRQLEGEKLSHLFQVIKYHDVSPDQKPVKAPEQFFNMDELTASDAFHEFVLKITESTIEKE